MTKAAMNQMTRNLACEWAPAVRVNAVAPWYISTELAQQVLFYQEGLPEITHEFLACEWVPAASYSAVAPLVHLYIVGTKGVDIPKYLPVFVSVACEGPPAVSVDGLPPRTYFLTTGTLSAISRAGTSEGLLMGMTIWM